MSIITAITKQGKNPNRVNLFLDGEFAAGLDAAAVAFARIKVGDEISAAELNEIALKSDINSAFDKAVKFLSSREHSEKEMRVYLSGKGYGAEAVSAAIARLKDYGYLSDLKFAQAFVSSYCKRYGKLLIEARLKEAGIKREVRDKVLDYPDAEGAARCARKYLATRQGAGREKLYRYLYNKGYASEAIEAACGLLENGNDE